MKRVVLGNIPSKANQYEIGVKHGKPSFRKRENIKNYEDSFVSQIWPDIDMMFGGEDIPSNKMVKVPFELIAHVYYKENRHDLDNAFKTLLDCCQLARLIANDNLCMHIEGFKHIDKANPRVEFEINEYKL